MILSFSSVEISQNQSLPRVQAIAHMVSSSELKYSHTPPVGPDLMSPQPAVLPPITSQIPCGPFL